MKRSLTMIITSIFISCSTGVERYYDLNVIRPEMVGFNGNSLKKIDGLKIDGNISKDIFGTKINTYFDHRIAMVFLVMGLEFKTIL